MTNNSDAARELVERARLAEKAGESAKALGFYDDALAAFGRGSTDPFLADVLRWKGTLLRERGETEAAYRCYTRSLDHAHFHRVPAAEAHALNCLAIISQRRGEKKEAERLYGQAAAMAERVGDTRLLGMIQQNRGVLANTDGDFAAAVGLYCKSLTAFELSGDAEPMSWVLNNLGMLHTKIGEFARAREYFDRALTIAIQRGDTIVESVVILNMAEAWVGSDRLDLADDLCERALEEAQRRGDHLTAAGALKVRASIERRRGAFDKSIATLRIAIYEADGAEDRLLHAEMLRELGEISRAAGNSGAARSAWREAAEAFRISGATHDLAEVEAQLGSMPE